jgi:hypothetical protein
MDIILLPTLEWTISPTEALTVMKESLRSIAVVVGSSPRGLVTAREVRKAKNRQQPNLKEVELEPLSVLFDGAFTAEGYAILNLPESSFAMVREHLLQTFPGMAHRQLNIAPANLGRFEQILPPGTMHGFLGYDRGAAVVMTRHETLAAQGAGPPPDCWCMNPTTPHEYPAGRKRTGQPCDNCGFSVEC